MNKISAQEINDVVQILKKMEPGLLPFEVFHQIARLYVTSIIEVVPLRKKDDQIVTLLLQRDKDDPVWPNMMHTPGTVVRASDESNTFKDAFSRILKDELCKIDLVSEPQFVDYEFHQVKRGKEMALVFYVEYRGKIKCGREVIVNQLPKNIVDTQLDFIKKAVNKFRIDNNYN
jgi:hypothetical protein